MFEKLQTGEKIHDSLEPVTGMTISAHREAALHAAVPGPDMHTENISRFISWVTRWLGQWDYGSKVSCLRKQVPHATQPGTILELCDYQAATLIVSRRPTLKKGSGAARLPP